MTHPHEALTRSPNPINDLGFGAETQPTQDGAADDGFPANMKFETRLEALQRETRERIGQIEKDIATSLANGSLWTVQAVLYPGKVFCLVYHGRNEDTEPLESQHPDAPAVFGPVFLIGKSHREAMLEAMRLFTVDEITIRTVR